MPKMTYFGNPIPELPPRSMDLAEEEEDDPGLEPISDINHILDGIVIRVRSRGRGRGRSRSRISSPSLSRGRPRGRGRARSRGRGIPTSNVQEPAPEPVVIVVSQNILEDNVMNVGEAQVQGMDGQPLFALINNDTLESEATELRSSLNDDRISISSVVTEICEGDVDSASPLDPAASENQGD